MLRQMGWSHAVEHETAEGFSLDLADPAAKRAIQVDDRSHYLKESGDTYVVDGATRFTSRLLRSFGWQIAHVPFFSWDGKSESQRRRLLFQKLAEIDVSLSSSS